MLGGDYFFLLTNSMEDFKYCVWLVPGKNHVLNSYTQGFPPHITIFSKLESLEEAEEKIKTISDYNLEVSLNGAIRQSKLNNFYALEYSVVPISKEPEWWPENAHVSLAYRYSKPFTEEEVQNLERKVIEKKVITTNLEVHRCSGHYSTWK